MRSTRQERAYRTLETKNITFFAWNARQPEIDALKEEVERLKVKIKLMSTPDAEMKERK